jgi:hypothetical protein
MKARHSLTPRRGSARITQITIAGFLPPLIVHNGKYIQNWNAKLRAQLRNEAAKLRDIAEGLNENQLSSISHPAKSPIVPHQEPNDLTECCEWSWYDDDISNKDGDFVGFKTSVNHSPAASRLNNKLS